MKRFVLPLALLSLGAMVANAEIAYTDPANQGTQAFGGNLALTFTVNSAITVTQLGVFNATGNGIIGQPIQVAIFNLGTSSLATPVVTFLGTYTPGGLGYDLFQSIAPVTLAPGTYEVDAVGFGGNNLNGNLNLGSTGPLLNTAGGKVTYTGAAWDYSTSLDAPTSCTICQGAPVPQNVQFDAGTFAFSASASAPEPGVYGTLALGLLGLLWVAIIRRRKNA